MKAQYRGGGRSSRGGDGRDSFDLSYQAKDYGENGHSLEVPGGAGISRSSQNLTFLFFKLGLVLVTILALSGSLYWALSISSSSRDNIYRGYRRLQEQVVSDLVDIGGLSLGNVRLKELDFCQLEYENYVPCYYNVSENVDLVDPVAPIEYERKCIRNPQAACLVLPPRNYRIPLRWPSGRDHLEGER